MAFARAQIVIPYDTGLPEDVITNTIYIGSPDPLIETADNVQPLIDALYTAIYADANVPANYLEWGLARVNWYELTDPEPRVPYTLDLVISPGTQAASTIPAECSIVLSFHAAPVAGASQARRRGRIYLGGFASGALTSVTNGAPRVAPGVIEDIVAAANNFRLDVEVIPDYHWSVYSPTNSVSGPLFVPIVGGWVDNAWDTQRRRGVPATARTLFPPP